MEPAASTSPEENEHLKVENLFQVYDSSSGAFHDVRAMLDISEDDF